MGTEEKSEQKNGSIYSWDFLAFAGRLLGNLDSSGKLLGMLGKFSAVFIWGAALYLGYSLVAGL